MVNFDKDILIICDTFSERLSAHELIFSKHLNVYEEDKVDYIKLSDYHEYPNIKWDADENYFMVTGDGGEDGGYTVFTTKEFIYKMLDGGSFKSIGCGSKLIFKMC
jgi:hypothetical protein